MPLAQWESHIRGKCRGISPKRSVSRVAAFCPCRRCTFSNEVMICMIDGCIKKQTRHSTGLSSCKHRNKTCYLTVTSEGSFPEVAVGSVRPAGASLCEGSEASYSRKARFARSCSVHVTFVRKDQMRLQIVLRVCDPKTGPGMWNISTYILLTCLVDTTWA